MSEYGYSNQIHEAPQFTFDKEKKERRRKLLNEIEARRRENYKQFMQKKQILEILDDIDMIA